MEIEKGETSIRFNDRNGDPHAISIEYGLLEFQVRLNSEEGGPFCAAFTQDQIKALLPYLQAFAESSTLEPTPLQGGEASYEKRIKALIETTARINAKNYEQEKHLLEAEIGLEKVVKEKEYCLRQLDKQVDQLAKLEELLEKWKEFVSSPVPGRFDAHHPDFEDWAKRRVELCEETSQILGE